MLAPLFGRRPPLSYILPNPLSRCAWTRKSFSSCSASYSRINPAAVSSQSDIGFAGIPVLSVKDWVKLGNEAAKEVEDIVSELTTSRPSNSQAPSHFILSQEKLSF